MDATYKHYKYNLANLKNDLPIKLVKPWQYTQQPVLKCSVKAQTYIVEKHHWEPFAWALSTLRWHNQIDNKEHNSGITFIEQAIPINILNILTDGATSRDADVKVQSKLVKIVFRKYYVG